MNDDDWLDISALARRAGVAASALRYYESIGLLQSVRGTGGRRRYPRAALRRLAFIRVAQSLGLSLGDVTGALARLPDRRTPTAQDWARLSAGWKPVLEARIAALVRLRDQLDACIGCGCLSLKRCALYNPSDGAARLGTGARYLLGDRPAQVTDAAGERPATADRPPRARSAKAVSSAAPPPRAPRASRRR